MSSIPVLYSFRRCPYAIRARMALAYAGVAVELREVILRNKPEAMLQASPKATVPVLCIPGEPVLEESLSIMHWALAQADPDNWLASAQTLAHENLITANDGPFKARLDQYKYADRHPEHAQSWYRDQTLPFLEDLDRRLSEHRWLLGAHLQMVDVALFPFIRQFAMVDRVWFDAAPFEHLRRWLDALLGHTLFAAVMVKNDAWVEGQEPVLFSP